MMTNSASEQAELNHTLAGGKKLRRKHKKHNTRIKYMRGGGLLGGDVYEIPQFPQMGAEVSPQGGNSAILKLNEVSINAAAQAEGDSAVEMNGGKKYKKRLNKSKKSRKNRKSNKSNKFRKSKRSRKSRKSKSRKY